MNKILPTLLATAAALFAAAGPAHAGTGGGGTTAPTPPPVTPATIKKPINLSFTLPSVLTARVWAPNMDLTFPESHYWFSGQSLGQLAADQDTASFSIRGSSTSMLEFALNVTVKRWSGNTVRVWAVGTLRLPWGIVAEKQIGPMTLNVTPQGVVTNLDMLVRNPDMPEQYGGFEGGIIARTG